jgi:hypothetical protein
VGYGLLLAYYSLLLLVVACWTWQGPVDEVWQQRPAPKKVSLQSKVSRLEGRTQMASSGEVVLLFFGKVAASSSSRRMAIG